MSQLHHSTSAHNPRTSNIYRRSTFGGLSPPATSSSFLLPSLQPSYASPSSSTFSVQMPPPPKLPSSSHHYGHYPTQQQQHQQRGTWDGERPRRRMTTTEMLAGEDEVGRRVSPPNSSTTPTHPLPPLTSSLPLTPSHSQSSPRLPLPSQTQPIFTNSTLPLPSPGLIPPPPSGPTSTSTSSTNRSFPRRKSSSSHITPLSSSLNSQSFSSYTPSTSSSGLGLSGRGVGDGAGSRIKKSVLASPGPTSQPKLFDFRQTDRSPHLSATSGSPHSIPNLSLLSKQLASDPRPVRTNSTTALPAAGANTNTNTYPNRPPNRPRAMSVTLKVSGEVLPSSSDDEDQDMGGAESGKMVAGVRVDTGKGSGGVKGRRKGMVFRCESCAKIYRHPSCLSKHRWEHSPHWGTSSKLLLSKHQQVQLLEAATILMHLDPTITGGKILPEDKNLWPSAVSPQVRSTAKLPHRMSFGQSAPVPSHMPTFRATPPSSTRPNFTPYTPSSSLLSGGRKTSPAGSSETESSAGRTGSGERLSGSTGMGGVDEEMVDGMDMDEEEESEESDDEDEGDGGRGGLDETPRLEHALPRALPVGAGRGGNNVLSPGIGGMGSLPELGFSAFHIGSSSPRSFAQLPQSQSGQIGSSSSPRSYSYNNGSFPKSALGFAGAASPGIGFRMQDSSLRSGAFGGIAEDDEEDEGDKNGDEGEREGESGSGTGSPEGGEGEGEWEIEAMEM